VTVAPSYGASSGERRGSWAVWPQAVELPDGVGGVLEVAGRLPGGHVVAPPLDEVLEASVVGSAVQDTLDLPLLLAVDQDRRWRWGDLAGEWVAGGVLQERDMEDRVEADGVG
jgi:hypothetical protein